MRYQGLLQFPSYFSGSLSMILHMILMLALSITNM